MKQHWRTQHCHNQSHEFSKKRQSQASSKGQCYATVVFSFHLKAHVLLQLRVQAEVVVPTGQIDAGGSHSLMGCDGQPGECLVRHLAMRKILINWTHVNDEAMPPIVFRNHKHIDTVLGPLCKPEVSAVTKILITYRHPRCSFSRFQGPARNMDGGGGSQWFNKSNIRNR